MHACAKQPQHRGGILGWFANEKYKKMIIVPGRLAPRTRFDKFWKWLV